MVSGENITMQIMNCMEFTDSILIFNAIGHCCKQTVSIVIDKLQVQWQLIFTKYEMFFGWLGITYIIYISPKNIPFSYD